METFTQPKITGYRQLSPEDAALMNEIKKHGEELGQLIERLSAMPQLDHRWINTGKTQLQQGIMALVRSVAQPTSF